MLDFAEFVATREGPAGPPRSSDSSSSWPGTGTTGEQESSSWEAERPSGLDAFRVRPPRRHAGPIILGIILLLAVVGAGGYLYYRFGRTPDAAGDASGPATVAIAEVVKGPEDAGLTLTSLIAALDGASAPDAAAEATLSLVVGTATAEPQDAGLEVGEPDGTGVAAEVDALPSPAIACGDALGEARDLWRKRDRAGALQKLRDALACDPAAVEPALQWGRWVLDSPPLSNDREVCTEGAAVLQRAAEANPDEGELWFHYTNLLYCSRQREAAQAAKQHCMGIRPADDYSSSCRFLPQ